MAEGTRAPAQLTSTLKQGKDEKDLSREAVYVSPGRKLTTIVVLPPPYTLLPAPCSPADAHTRRAVRWSSHRWSVSSAKPGNGVDLLVDGRSDSFWQSDGLQPHCITLEFHQPVQLSRVAIACDFRVDESYTPQKITIRVGTRWSDVHTLRTEEVSEPQGWIVIPLAAVRARVLQILILANHQNGRDTHVRQVKVFGPRKDVTSTLASRPGRVGFREVESTMYGTVR